MNLTATRERIRHQVPFLLAVFCFGVAGVDALGHGNYWLGGVNLGAAVGNLLALFLANRGPRWLEGVVLLINVPVALVQSASYFQAGKIGLPWVWLGVAIAYAVVGVYKTKQVLTG